MAASAYLCLAHGDHVLALLPYAVLAACPLMHVFMHRGHGHGGHPAATPDMATTRGVAEAVAQPGAMSWNERTAPP